MQLLMMLMLGSKALGPCVVNYPHLRNPMKAMVTEASKLRCPSREAWVEVSSNCLSMAQVIGILGFLSQSPMYLLIPLMMHWSRGYFQAENGRLETMCADR